MRTAQTQTQPNCLDNLQPSLARLEKRSPKIQADRIVERYEPTIYLEVNESCCCIWYLLRCLLNSIVAGWGPERSRFQIIKRWPCRGMPRPTARPTGHRRRHRHHRTPTKRSVSITMPRRLKLRWPIEGWRCVIIRIGGNRLR